MTKDVVIDTNVMRLYDTPKDPTFKKFFAWLNKEGHLTVSKKIIVEYGGAYNDLIFVLINKLTRENRYHIINNNDIKKFSLDKRFNYTCNKKDIELARVVFLSYRKKLIAFDKKLRRDINNFQKVNNISPCACGRPKSCCLQ